MELDIFFKALPQNIIFISPAGNNNLLVGEKILYPARLDNIISVGFINTNVFESSGKEFNKAIDYLFIGDSLLKLLMIY